MNILEGSKFVL